MPKLAQYRAKHDALLALPTDAAASILHVDMDAFFVSVELLARPELRGKAVIVGGQRDQRGVVTSASYEARKFGVHSAMALRTAAQLCPHAIFLDRHHDLYGQWSNRVAAVLGKYSPIVEMASIDEAYLDLAGTERLHGPPLAAADKLLREVTCDDEPAVLRRTGRDAPGGENRERAGQTARPGVGSRRALKRLSSRRSPCDESPESAK